MAMDCGLIHGSSRTTCNGPSYARQERKVNISLIPNAGLSDKFSVVSCFMCGVGLLYCGYMKIGLWPWRVMDRTRSDAGVAGLLRFGFLFFLCVAMGLSSASAVPALAQPAQSQAVVAQLGEPQLAQSQTQKQKLVAQSAEPVQAHSQTLVAEPRSARSQVLVAQAQSGASSPASASGQSPSTPGSLLGSSVPDLQHRAVDIESSQPDPHEQYLLGGGDEINVTVAGRPELSGVQVVGPDGRITLPLVGSVDVGEKSRDEASMAIDDALSKYYSGKVASTVQVTHYGSNHILLLGAVEHPGLIEFDQPPSLLEALTKGGSSTAGKSVGTPKRCIVYRGSNQVMNVNISERLDGQKALNDIRLRRNDIVYVPANQQSTISVLGEVSHPGAVDLSPEMTLVR